MDLHKKPMSPDNPTQILTTHDLSQLRTLQGVTTATVVAAAAAAQAVNTVTNGLRAINTTTQQQQSGGTGAGDDIGTRLQFLCNTNNQQAAPTTRTTTTSTTTTPHNLSNLLGAATAAVAAGGGVSKGATISTHSSTVGGNIISNKNNKNHTSHLTFAGDTIMPATSKYVLLQQNRSGQFTPIDPSNSSGGMGGNNGSGVPPTGSIVVLATEPFDTNYDHNQHNEGEGGGGSGDSGALDNDEELRSLTWLNNSNLIKEIVTTTSSTTNAGSVGNHKRSSLSNNICIVSASSAGNRLSMCNDVIKEITSHPPQIVATGSEEVNSGSEAQITSMSVSDFQQQFKRFSSLDLKDQSMSLSNIAQLGATTMYVGPSGTTTVVEYKTGPSIFSSTPLSSRQQVLNGCGTAVTSATLTINNTISNTSNCPSSSVPFSTSVGTPSSNINKNNSSNNNNNNAALILSNGQCNSNVTTTTTTTKGGVGSKHHLVLPNHTTIVANGNLTAQSNANNNSSNNNNNHIRNNNNNCYSNHTTNTNYQGHKQQLQQPHGLAPGTQNGLYLNKNGNNYKSNNSSNNGTGCSSNGISSTSTTHHPHKKYLREKMNVLDQRGGSGGRGGGGGGDGGNATSNLPSDTTSSTNSSNTTVLTQHNNCPPNSVTSCSPLLNAMGSTITVVSSPASSNSSLSTAAVNGGNSPPLNKTLSFFTLSASNTPISMNYAPTGNTPTAATIATTAAAETTEQRINISPFIGSAVSNTNTSVPSSSNLLVSTTVSTLPATSLMTYTAITSKQIPVGYTLVNHPMHTPPSPAAAYHHHPQQQQPHHNGVVDSISTTTAVTSLTSSTATTISVPLQQHTPNAVISTPSPAAVTLTEMQTPFSQMQNATKEYFTLNITSQQQQQQQQMLHNSPISYSSYDNDSLKDFEITPNTQRIYNNNNSNGLQRNSPNSKQQHNAAGQMVSNSNNVFGGGVMPGTPQKQKHPNNVPYDPLVHTHNKPPYSFSSLIFMAIEGSQEKALPVKEIYAWIVQHFPYFKTAPTGWKNSVRHNLSLNKSFVKVEKAPNMGKGSLWRVEQQQRQNLIQALNRSPFFQNPAIDKVNIKSPNGGTTPEMPSAIISANDFKCHDVVDGSKAINSTLITTPSSTHITSRFDPTLFPNLSKAFKDISDVVADVPDDDYPSDYSTTTITSKQTSCSSSNQSNKYNTTIYLNKNNNNNNNQNKSSQRMSDDKGDKSVNSVVGSSRGSRTTTNITPAIIPFVHYESIERLARDCGADSIDDVNAATAMLALKHGPKVFTEPFQNGAPVITSSPSEDHTYSAGGAGASSPSTSLNNGSSSLINSSSGSDGSTKNKSIQSCGDNQSNCASSDAAYESSEECHNVSPEELENQKRHLDGVDALLSLSLSSVMETGSNISNSHASSHSSTSPNKRPSTTSNEEEYHLSAMCNNNYNNNNSNNNNNTYQVIQPHNMSKMALLSTAATANVVFTNNSVNNNNNNNNNTNSRLTASNFSNSDASIADEGYNTQAYFGGNPIINGNSQQQQLYRTTTAIVSGGVKKPKPLRSLRTKIKRKAPWMR